MSSSAYDHGLRGLPTPTADQPVPHSPEAERHVLGCCLLDGKESIVAALQSGLTSKSFHSPANALIWAVIVELFRASPPISVEMLLEELRQRGQLEAAGGVPYIVQLADPLAVPSTAQRKYFIEKLREQSALRLIHRLGLEMLERAAHHDGSTVDSAFSGYVSTLTAAIRHARRGAAIQSLADTVDSVLSETRTIVAGQQDRSGWIHTGLPEFDQVKRPLGCAIEDHLVVVAGGSGHGKSALMRQIAAQALHDGQRVRIYSRETTRFGCIEQIAGLRAQVDLLHSASWTPDMLARFERECGILRDLADKRLWCVDNTASTPLETIEQLADDARHFALTFGAPHLWVVDYLQLFGVDSKRRLNSREQEVAYISHQLQALCRELGGVWLVGCQMNEKGLSEMRAAKRDKGAEGQPGKLIPRLPNAGDLRESQAIYHDADRVIALYMPPVDCRDQDQTGPNIGKPEMWLCQIKRRKGGTGSVKTWFEKRYTRFVEHGQGGAWSPGPTMAGTAPAASGPTKAAFKGRAAT